MIKILNWDSNFFGFNTASLTGANTVSEFQEDISDAKQNGVHLLYAFIDPNCKEIKEYATNQNYLLADNKVTFSKTHNKDHSFLQDGNIEFITKDNFNDYKNELYRLAFLSGHKSRFKVDDNMPKGKFEELYKLWVDVVLDEERKQRIIIYKSAEDIAGMVTYTYNGNNVKIGLIAVDEKYQGKSIGRKLMNSVCECQEVPQKRTVEVVTQNDNNQAMLFYQGLGFSVQKEELVYHIWLQ